MKVSRRRCKNRKPHVVETGDDASRGLGEGTQRKVHALTLLGIENWCFRVGSMMHHGPRAEYRANCCIAIAIPVCLSLPPHGTAYS
jgi:hypothetical protein